MNHSICLLVIVVAVSARPNAEPLAQASGHARCAASSSQHQSCAGSPICPDLRWRHVVRQRYDYSCGAAALATLIRYYFQDLATEDDILAEVLDRLTREEVAVRKELGLTMLDLKRCAQRRGYQAEGVRLELSRLAELRGPVLVHLRSGQHSHFAVLRGVHDGRAFLADPSRGQIRLPIACFAEEWTGIALVLGKPGFGLPEFITSLPSQTNRSSSGNCPGGQRKSGGCKKLSWVNFPW